MDKQATTKERHSMEKDKTLVALLRELKAEQAIPYEEIARGIGVSLSTVQKWFADEVSPSKMARPLIIFYLKRQGKSIA